MVKFKYLSAAVLLLVLLASHSIRSQLCHHCSTLYLIVIVLASHLHEALSNCCCLDVLLINVLPTVLRISSRIFCLGGKIVCKDQLCVKHAKFLSPFLSINHQCTKKHKARVFITRYCINSQNFWGGSWRVWGGSFPPAPPSR